MYIFAFTALLAIILQGVLAEDQVLQTAWQVQRERERQKTDGGLWEKGDQLYGGFHPPTFHCKDFHTNNNNGERWRR